MTPSGDPRAGRGVAVLALIPPQSCHTAEAQKVWVYQEPLDKKVRLRSIGKA